MIGRFPVRLLLPVLAIALVAAAWFVPEPAEPVVAGGRSAVPVRQSVWACPVERDWTVAAGQVKPGERAVAAPIPSEAAVDPVWADASRWREARPGGQALVLEQSGEGSGSVGFVAGPRGDAAVLGSCPSVVDDAWFVGLGDQGRNAAIVTLVNVSENRAVADLTWWGPNGPIQSLDTAGLVVEPGERREIEVDAVAAGEGAVAVHVSRRRGALTAIALDAGRGGADLVSPTREAARSQVLTGLPPGSTRLALVNPSTSTAHVAVAVRGRQGAFAAQGLEDVTVEPESTRVVEIPGSVELDGGSLEVTSDLPVVAAATVTSDDDVASVVPAAAISGPAVAPVRLDDRAVRLTLTAKEATEVTIESFSAAMKSLGTQQVGLEPGSSRAVRASREKGAAYVVITPADGATVMAGMWQTGGGALTAAPVRPAPVSVVAPGVSVR